MGFIHADDLRDQSERINGAVGSFKSFQLAGLVADQTPTPTGMREDVVLVSWLIVLLRTREGELAGYDWAYKNCYEAEPGKQHVKTSAVMPGLQTRVGDVAAAVSHQIVTSSSSSPASSLLLSTGTLSQKPEEAKDEPVLHLEVRFENSYLDIRPSWHSENMLPFTVAHHVDALVDTIKMCMANPDASIQESMRPTERDLNEIWRWNHQLPPTYDFCMHEVFSEQAQKSPEKVAISSWDGDLTYGQIEQYSSSVAWSLKELGVELHDVLPVCFEKSRWTAVAVLGVMKVGATLAMMDPSLPLARLQNMAKQVGAKTIVSSRQQYEFATSIIPTGKRLVVESATFAHLSPSQEIPKLPTVPASTLMYIIFTSGSTGTPKGVKISHGTYTSSAFPRAQAVGYTEESRVLDFASYAFDVSIDSMLLTLGNGGCLCIPSDEDRLNDINGVIRNMQINYTGLTPSVARILDPDVISSLSGLGLGGEAVAARDATLWGRDTRIIIGYGPCECTIGCTINGDAATGRDYISIGPGNGAAMWIVDPNDHEVLMPVGAVGELLVEGPIVGQGYLNDPEKTAAAFIEDPNWLVVGHKDYAGRRGRLYKTGDLGKWDPDGSGGIVFAGRKDTQVKLRGQRVELGEIESQLRARLPSDVNVIAEVIVPQGSGGQPTLVAFVASQSTRRPENTELALVQLPEELGEALSKANVEIAKVLPRYMVPTAYIPVNHLPVLISGKTDRKQLRALGTTVDLRQLDQGSQSTPSRELSDLEQRLRRGWGEILKIDPEGIRLEDNFFALGADSLAAMKLVALCRTQDLDLSVTNTFTNPTLQAMAGVVQPYSHETQTETPAFSMISQPRDSACLEASRTYGFDQAAIEDMYPCTPTQESLFTFSLKSKKPYVAQRVACIPSGISLDAWKRAWEDVVASFPILRTRVAQLQEPGLQQVVLKDNIAWKQSVDLDQYLEQDRNEKMNLGERLARYAIVNNQVDDKSYMVWTIHHVLYDGWSEPVILKQVSNAWQNQPIELQTQMREFVKWVRDTDQVAMQEFWRQELNGAVGPQFPRLPSRDFLPTPTGLVEHQINLEMSAGSPFTTATLIRGAWALVASQYSGSDDVVFGETLTGRDIALGGVEGIVGPLIATVPVRIHVHRSTTVEAYLQAVQQGMLARTPYQHMGMQNIRKVSQDAQHACEAPTGLVIQPEPEYVGSELGFPTGDVVQEALHFNPYPLMLGCGIRKGGFRVCASFDSSLIEVVQMKRVLEQLEVACPQLISGLDRRLEEISILPWAELNQIWRWNQTPPLTFDPSSKTLRANSSIRQGSVYPRAVVPWVCNSRNPSLLSPIGCVGELWLEGDFLPGETVESPAWLVAGTSSYAGRTGSLHATGDIVRLQEDGSLEFVARKENVVRIKGYAVDVADIEAHLTKQLPPTISAAVAISQSAEAAQQPKLIIFIEHPSLDGDSVEILSEKHSVSTPSFTATISTSIPTSLALALKKLDKFIHDSLPSYMAPSAYIVVDKLPTEKEEEHRYVLNQLATETSQDVVANVCNGLKEAWKKTTVHTSLTPSETVLRASWAKILGMSSEQIDLDDNFFRLGGDSVLAMKLVSSLRMQGHSLTVADIFQYMRLGDAAKRLKMGQVSTQKAQPYQPFSTLGRADIESFLAGTVRPKLANKSWTVKDVLPVTNSQALDVHATVQTPRTSIQYNMLFFEHGINREQLFHAWNELVKAHDILRTVFIESESKIFQVVLNDLDIPVSKHRADGDLEQNVRSICTADAASNFDLGSSFARLLHVEGNDGQECLVIRLSHAQYDGVSLPRLLQDFETLYTGANIADFEPFSAYVAQNSDENIQQKAISYWTGLLKGSSLSVLEGASGNPTDKGVFQTKSVDNFQPLEYITTANLLTAAWALLLARRLQIQDVTFGGVTSGRVIDMPNVENVQGPCYQLTPIRVFFETNWTAMDLLEFVQRQSADSAAHDFLGFDRIAKHCTHWSPEAGCFDSLVHHQDWDDFDSMPFADGSCKVDILTPDGDAPYPLKVVSFMKEGQMQVGVVGSERDASFVSTILDELAATVEELSTRRSEKLVDSGLF
ncbi:uncharacterized protein N7459_000125 [Penicillium hispanicum]|uniref:uncharacterized protein n=1 Tax=Penicillium hispanicum TaxID=1080232 RepID=UPI0025423D45|nr:uncharacterized protein N7459_000125 [Penicillium hispanicum]KAJ5593917.1 hypothetical protein N7459_000125 [Penicillium hispanicum]